MNIHRYILLPLLLMVCMALVGAFLISQWRQEKIDGLSTPLTIRFPNVSPADDNKTRVVLFGDSRMAQWRSDWPEQFEVINRGVSGSTSFQALERVQRDVLKHQADWVIIQVGINDVVASRLLFGQARHQVIDQVADNISAIVSSIRESGAKVILMSVVPEINADIFRLLIWQGSLQPEVNQINQSLQNKALGNIIRLNATDIFVADKEWRYDYSRDALHWNPSAYEAILHAVLGIIEP